ncbi:DUF2683 family protein [Sphingobacterium pedocola]|uniref:DUF2683 family protein n=1 Tax=Sphingobacterium pedocola TaxID=2082722 RepID=UPI0018C9920E|nr:DUF2683 family protein [Sphingobacterium pedocola]
MAKIVIHPKSKEQVDIVKAFVTALKMDFDTFEINSPYNPEFVKQILEFVI